MFGQALALWVAGVEASWFAAGCSDMCSALSPLSPRTHVPTLPVVFDALLLVLGLQVMVSTLPRSFATCKHIERPDIEIELFSQLNPMDKGIYEGMSLREISQTDPQFYQQFEENRLQTRFPGGLSWTHAVRFCGLMPVTGTTVGRKSIHVSQRRQ